MMSDIKQRLRFHGRFGNEDNVQQAIRKVTEREEAADHIATLEQESAANLQRALVAEKSTLTIALPDYDPRRIVIASDDYDDGERIVCVAIDNNGYVMLPNADNMTDEQAEAIAKVAGCCGGIAESIYRAIVAPRRRKAAIKAHDTSTQEVG